MIHKINGKQHNSKLCFVCGLKNKFGIQAHFYITENSRMFEGTGEIILPNGDVAVTAHGKYLKVPLEKITDFDIEENEWRVVDLETDPKEIEI